MGDEVGCRSFMSDSEPGTNTTNELSGDFSSTVKKPPVLLLEGVVLYVRRLTETGFAEVQLVGGQKVAGAGMEAMKKDDEVVLICKRTESPRYGEQLRLVRWWWKKDCPMKDLGRAEAAVKFLYEDLKLLPKLAEKIFDAYLGEAEAVIRENPYRLISEGRVRGIGLATVDKHIAPYVAVSERDVRRLRSLIATLLKQGRGLHGVPIYTDHTGESFGKPGGGHVFVDFTQVAGSVSEMMELSRKAVATELRAMATEPRSPVDERPLIVIEKDDEGNDRRVYSYALYMAEAGLAAHLRRLLDGRKNDYASFAIRQGGVALSEEQLQAIKMTLDSSFSMLTGGPGVGKTTFISALTATLAAEGVRFALCAPTGVASRRMAKATGQPAMTIHKLLGVNPKRRTFVHTHEYPLDFDFVVCDESSMVDLPLMYALVDAIKTGAHLLLVGDADQLPPVGPGAPFRDLIGSDLFPTTKLTKIYRQDLADSLIIAGSRKIIAGEAPKFSRDTKSGDLFAFTYVKEAQAMSTVLSLVFEKLKENFEIPLDEVQVISPHRRKNRAPTAGGKDRGTRALAAEAISEVIQEKRFGKLAKGQRFTVGDRVIHLKNNYDLDVMNGEQGIVLEASVRMYRGFARTSYVVQYDDYVVGGKRTVQYTHEESKELDLAYALSVHKTQGNEFPAVIVMAYSSGDFYTRNMLYTAITRGKRVVIVVSPTGGQAFLKILATKENPRSSRLVWRYENQVMTVDDLDVLNLDEISEDAGD